MPKGQIERHRTNRVGWLRAAVLGANDGVLSTASLVLGVAAAHGSHKIAALATMDHWRDARSYLHNDVGTSSFK